MTALTAKEINLRLKAVPDWSKRAQTISRTFKFKDFLYSLDFVGRVAKKAQKLNHHPDLDIRYDKVKLALTTHEAGGLTSKDFTLAEQCDGIFDKFSER
jgi:4a-hydroxytetrahydrobiopterin dehydratase